MVTLFAVPKPFIGPIATIQRSAIESWTRLRPACDIILLGDDPGTAELAQRLGLRHIAAVARNEWGTPLVNDCFAKAERAAASSLLCYVNADIILMHDFPDALVRALKVQPQCLVIGRRWNLALDQPLSFGPGWEQDLRDMVERHGRLFVATGIDYFAFPRGLWDAIPPFALGRRAWDNWLVYGARARGAAVVDATQAIVAVHQDHDYRHHQDGAAGVWQGAEAKRNLALVGGREYLFTIDDATHVLSQRGCRPAYGPRRLWRAVRTWSALHPASPWPARMVVRSFNAMTNVLGRLVRSLQPASGHPWDE